MKATRILGLVVSVAILLCVGGGAGAQTPQRGVGVQAALGAGFTYQGQLKSGDEPVTGDCEMAFRLYDGAAGDQVGQAITATVPITDGLFAVSLDFGSDAFAGDARWLGIRVKCAGDSDYADLGLQALTAAPYALYALGAPWSGLTGVPAGLDDGDDDTTYTAGDGLTLAGSEFSADTTYLQRRVGGECAVGSTIRVINADGTVMCQTDAPLHRSAAPTANLTTTLDSAGDVGEFTSLTIGSDGLGLISYYDGSSQDLKVAHCNDLACTSATLTTLDSAGDVGKYSSVTIGSDGLALISYYDETNGDLKKAYCYNVACIGSVLHTLDSAYDVGKYTSFTIGSDGLGLISYRDDTNDDLKAAHCNHPACNSPSLATLDSVGAVGGYTSVTIGSDGLGLISYYDYTNGDLKVAHCANPFCVPYFRRR